MNNGIRFEQPSRDIRIENRRNLTVDRRIMPNLTKIKYKRDDLIDNKLVINKN